MLIIGESINSTISEVGEAIVQRDERFITQLAQKQVECGAGMLDVNVAVAEGDERENLRWAVSIIQKELDVPLALDSRDPEALRAAMEVHQGRPLVNSISGEKNSSESLFPLVAEGDCDAILLCLDDNGIPKTAEDRLSVAASLVARAEQFDIEPDRLYVDPLIMAIGSDWQAPRTALDTLRLIKRALPQVRTVAGISNIGFGMPKRSLLNRTLLAMAIACGLDAFLVNVADRALMATVRAAHTIMGDDEYCSEYLEAYHAGDLEA